MKCPKCGAEVKFKLSDAGALLGSKTSKRKAKAARKNGKKGGRPRKVSNANAQRI